MAALRLLVVPVGLCFAAACGYDNTGSSSAPPPPTAAANDINMPSGAQVSGFQPKIKNVSLNGGASVSIRWVNRDYSGTDYNATSVIHNIVSDDNKFSPSGNMGGNDTYTVSLTAAGDYNYHCTFHPTTMQGTIQVAP
jgi:plastocyanin